MPETVWSHHSGFESADHYCTFELAVCESIWAGEAVFISSEGEYSPHVSVWDGCSCLFVNLQTKAVWKLEKPDWPNRGSFVEHPDLTAEPIEVRERISALIATEN
ncbi:MAG: hypothetical protein ACF8LL_13145 [Phycisphaerales bacterium]